MFFPFGEILKISWNFAKGEKKEKKVFQRSTVNGKRKISKFYSLLPLTVDRWKFFFFFFPFGEISRNFQNFAKGETPCFQGRRPYDQGRDQGEKSGPRNFAKGETPCFQGRRPYAHNVFSYLFANFFNQKLQKKKGFPIFENFSKNFSIFFENF